MKKNLLETLKTLALALVIACLVKNFVFASSVVDGSSMFPILEDTDCLVTSRYPYTYREVKRDDIIIFKLGDRHLVKRVVGLPGDKVEIKDSRVYINDEAIAQSPSFDEAKYKYMEEIPQGYFYVLGDNYEHSMDSRAFGNVGVSSLEGKVLFRIFPDPKGL